MLRIKKFYKLKNVQKYWNKKCDFFLLDYFDNLLVSVFTSISDVNLFKNAFKCLSLSQKQY